MMILSVCFHHKVMIHGRQVCNGQSLGPSVKGSKEAAAAGAKKWKEKETALDDVTSQMT